MKRKLKWEEIAGILFFLISVGMLGFSVYFCFSSDIWYDELFTMGLAGRSLGELISMTARDVHPPLYYLIVKLFLTAARGDLARQVTAAKLVSCLPFLLMLLFSAGKLRKRFGWLTAGLFGFLLLSMPQLADYTVEIRMYGFAALFITVGMEYAYELTRESKASGWIVFTLCALAACYTHYFACVAAGMAYLYLLLHICRQKKAKRLWKPYLCSAAVCAGGYLPWLVLVVTKQVGQIKGNYWIQPVSLRTLGGCVKFIFQPSFGNETVSLVLAAVFFAVYLLLLSGCGAAFIRAVGKKKNDSPEGNKKFQKENFKKEEFLFAAGCICVLAGLVLFGMLASVAIQPVFVYRYMLPAMGVFWLAFAIMTGRLLQKKRLLIPLLLFVTVIGFRNFRAFYGEEMYKRLQMETALSALSRIGGEDIVIYNFDQAQGVVSYYLSNDSYLWYGEPEELIQEMYPENHALVEGEFSDEAGIERLKELLAQGKPVWFLGSGNAREEILEKWRAEGIQGEEEASVMIERYWFNIYRITAMQD